jgi:hypothetical protein
MRTLKEQLQYIKDAGFDLTDPEAEDMLWSWFKELLVEHIGSLLRGR